LLATIFCPQQFSYRVGNRFEVMILAVAYRTTPTSAIPTARRCKRRCNSDYFNSAMGASARATHSPELKLPLQFTVASIYRGERERPQCRRVCPMLVRRFRIGGSHCRCFVNDALFGQMGPFDEFAKPAVIAQPVKLGINLNVGAPS
jgi:hypothetical protein